MSAMATAIPTKYHSLIEDRPEVLQAAKRATGYFESLYQSGPTAGTPSPIELNWTLVPGGPHGGTVEVRFSEHYEGEQKGIGYEFPLKYLLDTSAHEAMMHRLWRRVLIARSNAIGKRMFDALAELSQEEQGHGG